MEVITKVDANWWRVRKLQGGGRSDGLAPVNYMEVLSPEQDPYRVSPVRRRLSETAFFEAGQAAAASAPSDGQTANGTADSQQESPSQETINLDDLDVSNRLHEAYGGKSGLVKAALAGLTSSSNDHLADLLDAAEEEVEVQTYLRALYAYDGGDLAFQPGDELAVVSEVDSNWWRVKKVGIPAGTPKAEGLAPRNYVKILTGDELKHKNTQKRWRQAANVVRHDLRECDSMERLPRPQSADCHVDSNGEEDCNEGEENGTEEDDGEDDESVMPDNACANYLEVAPDESSIEAYMDEVLCVVVPFEWCFPP